MNAGQAEIVVKSSGSAEPALDFVAAAFEAKTGHRVRIYYSEDPPSYDVLVASQDAIERKFRPAGKVANGGAVLGCVGFGVAIRAGAPKPDISDPDALKRSILNAEHILVTDNHTSGLYAEDMMRKMGVYGSVANRILRCRNGPVLMDRLLAGSGSEFAFLAINALRTYAGKGLVLVGPLPADLQNMRAFMAAVATSSVNRTAAEALVDFCGRDGKPILAAHGFI